EPGQAHLGGCGSLCCRGGEYRRVLGHLRCPREGRSEGEVRHPGDVVLAAEVEKRFVCPIEEVVCVLDACDAGRGGVPKLADTDTADTNSADLALGPQGTHLRQLTVEVDPRGSITR